MDPIKEAFEKVKQDIDFLAISLEETNKELFNLYHEIDKMNENIENLSKIQQNLASTDRQTNTTNTTHSSTHNTYFKPLNNQILPISIGNEGVSTDRQTDTSTDRQTQNTPKNEENAVENALEILNSLDNVKKDIRLKFKRLTDQELLVFSTIYQLDEEVGFSDYSSLSRRLNLTESSIRDYVGRLIKKGIPVDKIKINNKNIQLNISKNLKKLVSLPTILQLKDL